MDRKHTCFNNYVQEHLKSYQDAFCKANVKQKFNPHGLEAAIKMSLAETVGPCRKPRKTQLTACHLKMHLERPYEFGQFYEVVLPPRANDGTLA